MQKLLIKWRAWKIDTPLEYGNFSLNGGYTISFRYNASRKWYVENAGVNILDQLVTDYVDIGKVSQEARKDKLFAVVEFDETKITASDLAFDLENDYKEYAIRVLTNSEAKEFIQDFTNCEEIVKWDMSNFILRPESTDELTWTTIEAYIITL